MNTRVHTIFILSAYHDMPYNLICAYMYLVVTCTVVYMYML